jgi:hypothetical protein
MSVSSTSIWASMIDHRLALLDVPACDDAVDRRFDAHLAQVVLRRVEARQLLVDALLLRRHGLLRLLEVGLAHLLVAHGLVVGLLGRQAAVPQVLLALQVVVGQLQRDPRAPDLRPRLLERRPGRREARLALIHRGPQVARVDLQQELPFRHAFALVDGEVHHAPHRVGADVHRPLGLDRPRRRHDGLEIALLDLLGVDHRRLGARVLQVDKGQRAQHGDDADDDENLLASHDYEPPIQVRTPAIQSAMTA